MQRLPVFNGRYTKEIVEIAFAHFMSGTRMYFTEGGEITTQAGFVNAVLLDPDIKVGEKYLHKMVDRYNKTLTPNDYRELKLRIRELEHENWIREKREIAKHQAPNKMSKKQLVRNIITIRDAFEKDQEIMWEGETITNKNELIHLIITNQHLLPKRKIHKIFKV